MRDSSGISNIAIFELTNDQGELLERFEGNENEHVAVGREGSSMLATDGERIIGHLVMERHDKDGNLLERFEGYNLVTQVGDQIYGERAVQLQGSASTITAITNATTSVVTTSAAHGLAVGDVVTIAGVTPAGYNGKWAVTAVGSTTTFSIYVGTALGAGSAFGTATGMSQAPPSGMKLGTGGTAVAKTGAGAALVTYLSGSNKAFDATWPQSSLNGSSRRIQYKRTYAAGEATTASPITEAVIVNDNIITADATSNAANTMSRILVTGISAKGASDTLTATWNHDLLGA